MPPTRGYSFVFLDAAQISKSLREGQILLPMPRHWQ
jgi:hypothetical protein